METTDTPLLTLHAPRLYFTGADRFVSLPEGDVDIPRGVTVMIGPNGSGKSTLAGIIERGWNFRTNRITSPAARPTVRHIEFADIHALAGFKVGYYQQRYEASMNDEVPTVASLLGSRAHLDEWRRLASLLHLEGALPKRVNFLSSGELRKLLIANLLFDRPDLLILDNPYIGLDAPSRAILDDTIATIAADGTSVLLLLADPADVPPIARHIIRLEGSCVYPPQPVTPELLQSIRTSMLAFHIPPSLIPAPPTPGEPHPSDSLNGADPLISMRHCRVAYGSSTIISDISWDILPGERWMLSGRNGSGKSTLLSLICADNPQRYVNDITAFGHHRRSGESIWDIKRHIGYISPEMHLHFHGSGDVATIVAQGLNDTVGLFVRVRPDQMALALEWLKLFGMEHLASRRFDTLSAGEQRLALLARTLIKQPRLLILDEPLHGLDLGRRRAVRDLVSALMERHPRSALIFVTHYPATELPDCINHSLSLS